MTTFLLAVLTGFSVATITFLADRFGHKVGGLIATAPVTATIGMIFVLAKSSPNFAREVVLAGNYSVIASFFAVVGYFYSVKLLKNCTNPLKVIAGEISFFIIYIGLVLFLRWYLPIGWYLFVIDLILAIILYFTFMRASIQIGHTTKRIKKSPKDILIRFISGFIVFFIIKIASDIETVISGALAVFPGVFSTSIGIIGIKQSAEFSAKAVQSGIFGVMAIAMFVLGYSVWIPSLSSGGDMAILMATASALTLYFLSIFFFAKIHTRT